MSDKKRARSETVDSFVVDSNAPAIVAPSLADDETLKLLLSPVESELIQLVNSTRAEPAAFAKRLEEEVLAHMGDDDILRFPGEKVIIKTHEGRAAVQEAIDYLRAIEEPRHPLALAEGLILATQDHVADQWADSNGFTGHIGSDGSDGRGRANRYGEWKHSIGESLGYGEQIAFRVVAKWIVDDGAEKRTNRGNILDPASSYIGLAQGAHRVQGNATVMIIAQTYKSDAGKIEERPVNNKQAIKDYKSARKRAWYGKNGLVTKTKNTHIVYDPNKHNCLVM